MSGVERSKGKPRGALPGQQERGAGCAISLPLVRLPRLGAETPGSLVLKNYCGKGNGPINPIVPGTVLESRNSKINKTQSLLPSAGQADKQCVACEHSV